MLPTAALNFKNHKYFNHFIVALTTLIIIIIIFSIFNVYSISIEDTKSSHQEKQLELAKSAANGISSYLGFISHELEYFASNSVSEEYITQYFLYHSRKEVVKTLFEVDSLGKVIFQVGRPIPNYVVNIISDTLVKLRNMYKGESSYSDVIPHPQNQNIDSLYFFMIIQNNNKYLSGKNTFLGYLISFDWLIQNFIEPLKLSENDFAWVIDNKGKLIYHPNHKEMLFRSVADSDGSCSECHASFKVQNEMLIKKMSVDEYFIIGEPKKIMAYVPIELSENSWILAISTYLPSIVSTVKTNFLMFFLLSGIAILLIIMMGMFLFNINLKRIRAEESGHFLEQSRAFQEKINHAAKLASIGELVDNVAHEINTPTGIISAEADALSLHHNFPNEYRDELGIIKDQTRRIKNYTRSLLNYSRRVPFIPDKNDIIEMLNECLFLLSPRIRANQIKITKDIQENISKFIFDKGRIEQVVINILNNAIDSVKDEREIIISVRLMDNFDESMTKNYVTISISDKGIGIPDANTKKIFEPFFSTKSPDEGTGLGLSISKAIINRHNGNITVESSENIGTTFSINLPYLFESSIY